MDQDLVLIISIHLNLFFIIMGLLSWIIRKDYVTDIRVLDKENQQLLNEVIKLSNERKVNERN